MLTGFLVTLLGMGIVFSVLVALVLVMWAMGRLFPLREEKKDSSKG